MEFDDRQMLAKDLLTTFKKIPCLHDDKIHYYAESVLDYLGINEEERKKYLDVLNDQPNKGC